MAVMLDPSFLMRSDLDLCLCLAPLTEAAVADVVYERAKAGVGRTRFGPLDYAVNLAPFTLSQTDERERGAHTGPESLDHAEELYSGVRQGRLTQAVVHQGETGSGKTTRTHMLLQRLLARSLSSEEPRALNELLDHVRQVSSLLEVFTNASTASNPNSSRSACLVQITYAKLADGNVAVVDMGIKTFGREVSRTTVLRQGEGNFHVLEALGQHLGISTPALSSSRDLLWTWDKIQSLLVFFFDTTEIDWLKQSLHAMLLLQLGQVGKAQDVLLGSPSRLGDKDKTQAQAGQAVSLETCLAMYNKLFDYVSKRANDRLVKVINRLRLTHSREGGPNPVAEEYNIYLIDSPGFEWVPKMILCHLHYNIYSEAMTACLQDHLARLAGDRTSPGYLTKLGPRFISVLQAIGQASSATAMINQDQDESESESSIVRHMEFLDEWIGRCQRDLPSDSASIFDRERQTLAVPHHFGSIEYDASLFIIHNSTSASQAAARLFERLTSTCEQGHPLGCSAGGRDGDGDGVVEPEDATLRIIKEVRRVDEICGRASAAAGHGHGHGHAGPGGGGLFHVLCLRPWSSDPRSPSRSAIVEQLRNGSFQQLSALAWRTREMMSAGDFVNLFAALDPTSKKGDVDPLQRARELCGRLLELHKIDDVTAMYPVGDKICMTLAVKGVLCRAVSALPPAAARLGLGLNPGAMAKAKTTAGGLANKISISDVTSLAPPETPIKAIKRPSTTPSTPLVSTLSPLEVATHTSILRGVEYELQEEKGRHATAKSELQVMSVDFKAVRVDLDLTAEKLIKAEARSAASDASLDQIKVELETTQTKLDKALDEYRGLRDNYTELKTRLKDREVELIATHAKSILRDAYPFRLVGDKVSIPTDREKMAWAERCFAVLGRLTYGLQDHQASVVRAFHAVAGLLNKSTSTSPVDGTGHVVVDQESIRAAENCMGRIIPLLAAVQTWTRVEKDVERRLVELDGSGLTRSDDLDLVVCIPPKMLDDLSHVLVSALRTHLADRLLQQCLGQRITARKVYEMLRGLLTAASMLDAESTDRILGDPIADWLSGICRARLQRGGSWDLDLDELKHELDALKADFDFAKDAEWLNLGDLMPSLAA